MFEQAELQGTQMGRPNGPPHAKGTALIAPEIANYRKPGRPFGSFWPFFAQTAILVILASHFRARAETPTKSPTWGLA